jgi:acetyl-CoA carboxylase biotin carboxylase subunit
MNLENRKILIANRGEITKRVIFACKELGIKTVTIYSDADKGAEFTQLSDESYPLEGNESKDTYLDISKIITIAKKAKVDAIHPGYGFLSEEPELPKQCEKEGILFIGPNSSVMKKLGLKVESKKIADKLRIPRSPGSLNLITSTTDAKKFAKEIGYPVIIKATGGGGGKGMRLVESEKDCAEAVESAQKEAKNAFSEPGVFVEKYIPNLRHIEIQIIGDSFGEALHFFERECSIQRNHQKVVEEAPSVFLTQKEREQLGKHATNLAKEVGYVGAGTVEFICDTKRNFYFCEMNTRIQVEHGVTELITGIDLIKEQISVCFGNPLSMKQEDISFRGAAIECRINAENPSNSFMPSIGTIIDFIPPQGEGLRIDGIVKKNLTISPYYDSLILKLMSYGKNREEARRRMIIFLESMKIEGIKTNISLHKTIMSSPNFIKGNLNANFLKENNIIEKLGKQETYSHTDLLHAALSFVAMKQTQYSQESESSDTKNLSSWVHSEF